MYKIYKYFRHCFTSFTVNKLFPTTWFIMERQRRIDTLERLLQDINNAVRNFDHGRITNYGRANRTADKKANKVLDMNVGMVHVVKSLQGTVLMHPLTFESPEEAKNYRGIFGDLPMETETNPINEELCREVTPVYPPDIESLSSVARRLGLTASPSFLLDQGFMDGDSESNYSPDLPLSERGSLSSALDDSSDLTSSLYDGCLSNETLSEDFSFSSCSELDI